MKRRDFMLATGAAVGSLAIARPLAAAPARGDPRDRQILLLARQQIDRVGAWLSQRDRAGIADFGVHSTDPRFHLVDLAAGTVSSFRVAHGTGSDPENDGWLNHFSNLTGTNGTSRGAFVTGTIEGASLALAGLDHSNSNAAARGLALHPFDDCTAEYVERQGRLGRSNGSLALAPADFLWVARQLPHGRLVFADRLKLA